MVCVGMHPMRQRIPQPSLLMNQVRYYFARLATSTETVHPLWTFWQSSDIRSLLSNSTQRISLSAMCRTHGGRCVSHQRPGSSSGVVMSGRSLLLLEAPCHTPPPKVDI